MFLLRQTASVWIIPLVSILCCAGFWFCVFPALRRSRSRSPTLRVRPKDGFISSMLVLFYTLFPSVVNRIALTFSCKTYGDRNLLTEALSVQCLDGAHWIMIVLIGIPGMLLFVFLVPGLIANKLITQRRKGHLYPMQAKYEPRWTLRLGFMFAGYRQGYEWWEAVVMLRKCAFVLLSIFLRTYGASPQVVAASMVLIVATSAHLQHRPYQDPAHNWLESVGLHVCLLQLLVALISNMIGRVDRNVSESPLGSQSTVVVILIVFASTAFFFWEAFLWTVQKSHETRTQGAVGAIARCCAPRVPNACSKRKNESKRGRSPGGTGSPHQIVPAVVHGQRASNARLNFALTLRALENQRRKSHVEEIQNNSYQSKDRLMKKIKRSETQQAKRLQARLAARAKVKRTRALEKCGPFASLDAVSISTIVDAMEFAEVSGADPPICREGAPADTLSVIVKGTCTVTIRGQEVARLEELAVFGESSLFGGESAKRNATVSVADGVGSVKLLQLSRRKWERLFASGVLSEACVAALRTVQEERAEMNAQALALARPSRPPPRSDPLTPLKI